MQSTRGRDVWSRRAVLAGLLSTGLPRLVRAATSQVNGGTIAEDWPSLSVAARRFVDAETPMDVWPFATTPVSEAKFRERKVWIHYFTPLPLSLDNRPPSQDYYRVDGLQRDGSRGNLRDRGGYLRNRPLTPDPWASARWRQINAAIDIFRAERIEADAFMLDIDWLEPKGQLHEIMTALCEAADNVSGQFRIVAQPDMASLATETPRRIGDFVSALARDHPSVLRLSDGRLLVAPFAADKKPPSFWNELSNIVGEQFGSFAFLPIILNMKNVGSFVQNSYGISNWGVREAAESAQLASQLSNAAKRIDTWLMPIAPQDARPRSSIFWEAGNTRLFRSLWKAAIEYNAPGVHLITWNDFGEGTAIEPSFATQFVFYDLAAYFISYFKAGRPPQVLKDAIYYTHRRQIVANMKPAILSDLPMRNLGKTPVSNDIELLAFLTAPAELEIEIGDKVYHTAANSGLSEFHAPAQPGTPRFRILRRGRAVVDLESAWSILDHPDRDDFTYFGGSSTRKLTGRSSGLG